jgi:hypothetical protein
MNQKQLELIGILPSEYYRHNTYRVLDEIEINLIENYSLNLFNTYRNNLRFTCDKYYELMDTIQTLMKYCNHKLKSYLQNVYSTLRLMIFKIDDVIFNYEDYFKTEGF